MNREVAAFTDKVVKHLAADIQPLQIILFGSQARGDALPDSDIELPSNTQLDRLSEFAVLGRYPDPDPAPTHDEAQSLIALARSLLDAVEEEPARRQRQLGVAPNHVPR